MKSQKLLWAGASVGVAVFIVVRMASHQPSMQSEPNVRVGESTAASDTASSDESPETGSAQSPAINEDKRSHPVEELVENGEPPGSSEFTRARFFEPFDWGANLSSAAAVEDQLLNFGTACQSHPRFSKTLPPDQWAEQFTQADAAQRWPSGTAHVIDWNQFWTLGETGFQVSVRWNFENPPLYRVVGYSFSTQSPDGYGAEAFPEKNQIPWDEAKAYVQAWESDLRSQGATPGTRTMSLSSSVFNPSEVAPEDIERAEYTNTRVRGAQSGRMSCNTLYNDTSTLSCRCY